MVAMVAAAVTADHPAPRGFAGAADPPRSWGGQPADAGLSWVSVNFTAARRAEASIARLSAQTAPWRELAPALAAALRGAVGFDCFSLCQHDPVARMPAGGVADNHVLASQQRRFWQIEIQSPDVNKSDHLADAATPVAALSAATGGDLARSTRWAELLGPGGLGDELRAVLVLDGRWWSSLSLYRERRSPAFTERDAATIGRVAPAIAAVARAAWTIPAPPSPSAPAPGTILVSADGRTISATVTARTLLRQLDPANEDKGAVVSAAAARLSVPGQTGQHATALRSLARGIDGAWLQIDAARLDPPAGEAAVAITVQPAAPEAVTELLMHAHALTTRERQVVRLALAGASTADIAAQLFLSRHTVSDYLKAIFTKTGTHSRQELALHLTGAS